MKIIITESQYKKILNEGDFTTLLIGGVAALGLYGIKVFFKIFFNVFIDSVIDGFFGYIDDIKNIVAPEPYIKFLKGLEKNERFINEFLTFVEESKKDGRLNGSPFWIENVTNLPSFIELFNEFTEKENIGEFEKNQLLILIRKSMIKTYARNGHKIVEALKKKMSDNQNKGLNESEEEQKVLHIPSLKFFNDDWDLLQKFLKSKGNPPYTIGGDLDLYRLPVKSLGNLQSMGGYLDLRGTPIKSLGNLHSVGGWLDLRDTPIKSLGNLTSVGGYLDLRGTPIKSLGNLTSVGGILGLRDTPIESLGNLQSVGGYLDLEYAPLSNKYTEEDIRQMVDVGGEIYL
jgi:hypothetical protein